MKWNVNRQLVSKIDQRHTKSYIRDDGRFGFRVNCYLTFKCSLDCHYCTNKYLDGVTPCSDEMDLTGWMKAIEGFQLPIMHVYITGGEPTLHPDFSDIVNSLLGRGYSITLMSNLTNGKMGELIKDGAKENSTLPSGKQRFRILATRHVGYSSTMFKDRLEELRDYPIYPLEFEEEQLLDVSHSLSVMDKDKCLNEVKFCIGPDGKFFTSKRDLLENYAGPS
ncbi:hypothetical protein LCGC14_0351190 [marine sediment metagenome]|uniref:Radical SAM core domain-containing protein n=1 Tax=marine sediment metagenome TaxID=412755 RepID=A0A0F9TAP9_9ZZZZ